MTEISIDSIPFNHLYWPYISRNDQLKCVLSSLRGKKSQTQHKYFTSYVKYWILSPNAQALINKRVLWDWLKICNAFEHNLSDSPPLYWIVINFMSTIFVYSHAFCECTKLNCQKSNNQYNFWYKSLRTQERNG